MTQAPLARLMLLLAITMACAALVRAPGGAATPIFALSLTTPNLSFSVAL